MQRNRFVIFYFSAPSCIIIPLDLVQLGLGYIYNHFFILSYYVLVHVMYFYYNKTDRDYIYPDNKDNCKISIVLFPAVPSILYGIRTKEFYDALQIFCRIL